MIESIKDLLQKEAQAVLNIPVTDAYEKAVDLIIEQICIKKGNEHCYHILFYRYSLCFSTSK